MKSTFTKQVMYILSRRRTVAIAALAGGSLFSGVVGWDAFTSPIQWSPHSSSAGGWFESPGLDSINDGFNHAADLAVWSISGAFHMVLAFVGGAIVFAAGVCVLDASARFVRWFTANFRLA